MANVDREDLLRAVPLFSSLSKKQLHGVATTAVERTYKAGDTIVKQGDKGVGFYLVLGGHVDVWRADKNVGSLGAGQFFGEMALFDDQPRSADVRAASDVVCLVLNRWEFWGAVGRDPEIVQALFRETIRRLRPAGTAFTE